MLKIKTNRFFKNLLNGFGRPKKIYVNIKQDEKKVNNFFWRFSV